MPGAPLTEAEWLTGTNLEKMFEMLFVRANDRKERLLTAAYCRRFWHLLTDDRVRQAVEVGEQYADALVSKIELRQAREAALLAEREDHTRLLRLPQDSVERERANQVQEAFNSAVALTRSQLGGIANRACSTSLRIDRSTWQIFRGTWQIVVLHDLFGPTLFHDLTIHPAVLASNNGQIMQLAQACYADCHKPAGTLDNRRLAVLADALEEAGCTDTAILAHCRGAGPHVRGCWVLDLLLGKEQP